MISGTVSSRRPTKRVRDDVSNAVPITAPPSAMTVHGPAVGVSVQLPMHSASNSRTDAAEANASRTSNVLPTQFAMWSPKGCRGWDDSLPRQFRFSTNDTCSQCRRASVGRELPEAAARLEKREEQALDTIHADRQIATSSRPKVATTSCPTRICDAERLAPGLLTPVTGDA